jgi:hypothetical protein
MKSADNMFDKHRRQVIGVFIDEDMGQQAGAGATALDRA